MSTNENGGCPEGQTADGLDAVQGVTSTVPQYNDFPRPRGATPLYPPLALLPDDPQDMGDALALEALPQSYVYRWMMHLARGEA